MSNIELSANAEQHKNWISEGGYTFNSWKKSGFEKYKDQGAVCDPAKKFNVSWYWLSGNEETQVVKDTRKIADELQKELEEIRKNAEELVEMNGIPDFAKEMLDGISSSMNNIKNLYDNDPRLK